MGNPKAFLEIHRQEAGYRPLHDRIHDFGEVEQTLNTRERKLQASRCMDCGVPFCHWACPLGNKAPEWNDALYKGEWELAYRLLSDTNPFPEFTGRVCPALCEKACVLNRFNHEPTTNRENECAITEAAFREGYILPVADIVRNGKKVAVVGAGPAGLAAAQALNLMGYTVTVYEKNEAAGGLLRYGIPNFKLNKAILDRRILLLEQEGIKFRYGEAVDCDDTFAEGFDAVVLSTGTPTARDLKVPGRQLKGVHFALELLSQQNRVLAGMDALVRLTARDARASHKLKSCRARQKALTTRRTRGPTGPARSRPPRRTRRDAHAAGILTPSSFLERTGASPVSGCRKSTGSPTPMGAGR